MTCKVYDEEVLFSYTLGELNEQEIIRLKKHLEHCSSCHDQVEDFLSLKDAWDHHPASHSISNTFVDYVMKEISTDDSLSKRLNFVSMKKGTKDNKKSGRKNAFLHFALATAATFVLLYSGIFDQMYQSVGDFTTTFSETTNQVQHASAQGVNWLNVNFNFSQLMYDLKK